MIDFDESFYDKRQSKLTETGIAPNTFKFAKETLKDIMGEKSTLCPFCLSLRYYSNFIHEKGFFKCEHCKIRMTEETLKKTFKFFQQEKPDIKSFARWVFEYRLSGFFEKINFEEFNEKLKLFGWNYDFWGYYKMFKGEYQEQKEDNEY